MVRDSHTSNDFIDFLKILDDKYHAGDVIRIVLDNHTVHTSRKVQDHLATRPGSFILGFTPKHGFWLNMIESIFGKMNRQMLRVIRVHSKEELVKHIL